MADYLIYIACASSIGWLGYQMGFNTGYEKGVMKGLCMQITGFKAGAMKEEYLKEKKK